MAYPEGSGSKAFRHTHTYDRANRMLSATTPSGTETYRYDGHGRRTTIVKTGQLGQSTHFYSRAGQLLYDRAPSGSATRHIYLGGRLIASVAGSTESQHTDTLGSIVRRTNLIRGTVGTTVYEPYGSLGAGTVYEQRPGFTGHMTDNATTLSYMQQRYYDSTAMRFLSVDPLPVSTTDGSNFNRYWYANNNPYKYTDPNGKVPVPIVACAAAPAACGGAIVSAAGAVYFGAKALVHSISGTDESVYSEAIEGAASPEPAASGKETEGAQPTETDRNPADDQRLSAGEVKALEGGGEDVHEMKGGKDASRRDLFKDKDENINVKPKDGSGPGEPTGLNIKDYKIK